MVVARHCRGDEQFTINCWGNEATIQPAYRLRNEQFRLAVRHRLGMLPYDDLRDEYCFRHWQRQRRIRFHTIPIRQPCVERVLSSYQFQLHHKHGHVNSINTDS